MTDQAAEIDPILSARLDLLEQVLKEVEEIRGEMAKQRETLQAIEEFLKDDGHLHKLRSEAVLKVGDASLRLKLARETHQAEEIESALHGLTALQPLIMEQLDSLRKDAYRQLLELQKWSVVTLDDSRLGKAENLYKQSLREIRESTSPWAQYEAQMRSRGEALFSAYLDMLGSIAIRGIPVGDDLDDERRKLLKLLLRPMGSDAEQQQPHLRALNLLTRSEHIQLGYRGWNVWALPLLGQEVGLNLIQNGHLDPPAETAHHVICADAYAAHVLGPSYAAAAIFLELDPDGPDVAGVPSDRVRAELLLEQLPTLAKAPQVRHVEHYADRLREAWEQAKAAVGAKPTDLSEDVREVTRKFLERLSLSDYSLGLGYDLGGLGDRSAEAERLAKGESPNGSINPRDLLVSMWWARLNHPEAHWKINRAARAALLASAATFGSIAPRPASTAGGRTLGD